MRKSIKMLVSIITIICISLTYINVSAGDDTTKWKTVNEYYENVPAGGMAYGNNVYVAVGGNCVMTSTDGEKWNIVSIGDKSLYNLAFNGEIFVAVGNKDIATSTDGVHWTFLDLQTSHILTGIIWTGTQFIAVGNYQTVLTSNDGLKWELVHSVPEKDVENKYAGFNFIAYNNEVYVAGGYADSAYRIRFYAVSKDLKTWEYRNIDSNAQMEKSFIDIIWDGKRFIGISSKMVIMESSDGLEWKELAKLEEVGYWSPTRASIAFNGFRYFISFGVGMPITSGDGINWTQIYDNPRGVLHFKNIFWCRDRFYALTDLLLNGGFVFSKDGNNWEDVSINIGTEFNDIVWNGTIFCAVGSNAIFTSKDGEDWTWKRTKEPLYGIAWGKEQFVAVGEGGLVMTSPDGVTWTEHKAEKVSTKVIWDGSMYIACGRGGIISTSADGSTWTGKKVISDETFEYRDNAYNTHKKTAEVDLLDISYNGNLYAAVGGYSESIMVGGDGATENYGCGYIYTSTDRINWKKVSTTGSLLNSITYSGGMFSAVGNNGVIYLSYNGVNWAKVKSKFLDNFSDVIWNGNKLIAVSSFAMKDSKSAFISSVDGVNWDYDYYEKSGGYCLAWNGQNLVSAGKGIKSYSPDDVIKVIVNKKPLVFDVVPVIKDSRTLVPMRIIFEALGAKVEWDAKTKTVAGIKDGKKIVIKIDDRKAMVGGAVKELDVPASIVWGRTFVPLRFIGESFSNNVEWDEKTKTVQITNN